MDREIIQLHLRIPYNYDHVYNEQRFDTRNHQQNIMVTTQFLRSHVVMNGFLTRHWYDRIGAVDISIGDVGSRIIRIMLQSPSSANIHIINSFPTESAIYVFMPLTTRG